MIGALIGDTVGSVYEFDNIKTRDFPLLSPGSRFTDDSVMTLAVAEILQRGKAGDPAETVRILQKWGRAFPDAGYGASFIRWLFLEDPQPYGSCGNGAAMRVSPVGWYADSERQVRDYARAVTAVTHNHPEGLTGAEVTAMCVYYARLGRSRDFIRQYASQYYDLSFDYEELRRSLRHDSELCRDTVPQAIFCFLVSGSFEDCLRTAVSIGGDCDTTAAISCAIADAYYNKIDRELLLGVLSRLPEEKDGCNAGEVLSRFISRRRFLQKPPAVLTGAVLDGIDPARVIGVQIAHPGAMGRPGLRVYTAEGGDLTEYESGGPPAAGTGETVSPEAISPEAVRERLSVSAPGFCEYYLGMGNFLWLRSGLKPAFDAVAEGLTYAERYAQYRGLLWKITR